MNNKNVTLSINKDLLKKAKGLARKRNTTLSGLLASALEALVFEEERYQEAQERNIALLTRGLDLGTKGEISWKREDLHAR